MTAHRDPSERRYSRRGRYANDIGLHHDRVWWDAQRTADARFQALLRKAGAPEGVVKTAGTATPVRVTGTAEPAGARSSMGFE